MEPFSKALFVCGMTAALYQMCGTPFLLNILIFCLVTLLCVYAMLISGHMAPSDVLYNWFYGKHDRAEDKSQRDSIEQYDLNQADDQITKRLRELTGHIVRDFILSWYNTVSEDVTFVQEAFEIFEHLLTESRASVARVEGEKMLSAVLTELLEHCRAYQKAVRTADASVSQRPGDGSERRNQLIIVAYCDEREHPAMENIPDSEMRYLRGLVVLLLKALLPHDYKLTETPLYAVRELVAQNVFGSLVDLTSDPLWIYNMIAKVLLDDDSPESKDESVMNEHDKNYAVSCNNIGPDCHEQNETEFNAQILVADESNPVLFDRDRRPRSAASEDTLTGSLVSNSSCDSHFSDSFELDANSRAVSSSVDDDIPLPLTSLSTHFSVTRSDALPVPVAPAHALSPISGTNMPSKGRLFYRIRIPFSTTMQESFEGGGKYTLYRISYRTIKEQNNTDQNNASGVISTEELEHGVGQGSSPVKIVKHQVQRRFREFLALQERLAENMVAKTLISDIRGPSRMFPVPFGNMDKDYIETRRKFLQAYLREMCSIPFVNSCKEMREFLAYEMDPRIAFVRKPDSIPRIDKIFKSAVQDLFGTTAMKFSSTLVLDDDDIDTDNEQLRNIRDRLRSDTASTLEGAANRTGPVTKLKNMMLGSASPKVPSERRPSAQREFVVEPGNTQKPVVPVRWVDVEEANQPTEQTSMEMRFFHRTSGDGCDAPSLPLEEGGILSRGKHDMIESLFRLVLHAWRLEPGVHNIVVLSLHEYVGKYLTAKMDHLTSVESWTGYLSVLRDSLWPGGTWGSGENDGVTWDTAPEHAKTRAIENARRALNDSLPSALSMLVGEAAFQKGISELLDSFQHTAINRRIFYFLLDMSIEHIFPNVHEVMVKDNVFLNTVPIT